MSTFSAKGTDVDVEAIMANIRRKIEEKRKGLYTEDEVQEIAEMKLDAVLEASEFNSDFVAAFRARDENWNYRFGPETIYASSHAGGGGLIRAARRILNPVLKLFFNPNPITSALSRQADLNRYYVILLHNMAEELTRANLELTNLKARLRTLGVRVDFQGKREKTMEQVVLERESREPREPRQVPARSSDRPEPSERQERGARGARSANHESSERGERDRGGERPDRGDRDRGERGERERAERDRGERDGARRGRGRRSFRRRRGGGGGGSNRGDSSGRPPSGNRSGGGSSGPREGSGGNRS
ncbi:MAG TPA: hypothetical protein VJH87_08425 [Vicinamibacteria bacterium]|nr:hypothetical protein [Vicinamibacteria bacterium]